MSLSEELRQAISDALELKAPQFSDCPVCGTNDWVIEGLVFFVLQDAVEVRRLGGPGLPSCAFVCSNCGHTLLFNLLALGVTVPSHADHEVKSDDS